MQRREARAASWAEVLRGTPYRFVDRLGSGAYSDVLLARAGSRLVAIKVLSNADASSRARFLHEQQLHLDHPNVIRHLDWMQDSTRALLVMEFAEGGDLQSWLERHPVVSREVAEDIARQLLAALAYLHDRRILHRDLKPSNVLLATGSPERPRVLLSDLGVALDSERDLATMRPGPLGTVGFLAPEVWEHGATVASDLYSLGLVLGMVHDHCDARSPQLAALVERLTALSPDARPSSAHDAASMLPPVDPGAVVWPAQERPDRYVAGRTGVPRSRVLAVGAAVAATVLVGAGVWMGSSDDSSAGPPDGTTDLTLPPAERAALPELATSTWVGTTSSMPGGTGPAAVTMSLVGDLDERSEPAEGQLIRLWILGEGDLASDAHPEQITCYSERLLYRVVPSKGTYRFRDSITECAGLDVPFADLGGTSSALKLTFPGRTPLVLSMTRPDLAELTLPPIPAGRWAGTAKLVAGEPSRSVEAELAIPAAVGIDPTDQVWINLTVRADPVCVLTASLVGADTVHGYYRFRNPMPGTCGSSDRMPYWQVVPDGSRLTIALDDRFGNRHEVTLERAP